MIREISSTLAKFKAMTFKPGLNIILAEKTEHASQRQTRNGAGKTSFIELVHFLTGANAGPKSMFRLDPLDSEEFGMRLDVGSDSVTVRRSGAKPGQVTVELNTDGSIQMRYLPNEEWKTFLGEGWFGLPKDGSKNGPSLRSLFSYFARRQDVGGFDSTFNHTRQQQRADEQVNLSYLLGLDWRIPQDWQEVRDRERGLRELRKAVNEGVFGQAVGDVAILRTELAVAERSVESLKSSLQGFRVVEQYAEFEAEASELTRRVSDLNDDNAMDRLLVDTLISAIQSEQPPETKDLESVYAEVGVILPASSVTRYEDVLAFHESVIANRRQYLQSERQGAEGRIAERNAQIAPLDSRRADVMALLQSGGALDHYTSLQGELSRRVGALEALRQRFEAAQRFESARTALDLERSELELRLQRDFTERASLLDRAIVVFEELSSQLYEQAAGSLTIRESPDGPLFSVEMHAKRSKGIRQMQVFCFDLMLMTLSQEKGVGPGFLVHDSHLFDGVDGRQVGKALELGARLAEQLGFQYIVTMNSDAVPSDLPKGFDPADYVVPVPLTDAGEDGGLFGVRFQ
jgi:uncharacterized protein YydD (DUF2326 family)